MTRHLYLVALFAASLLRPTTSSAQHSRPDAIPRWAPAVGAVLGAALLDQPVRALVVGDSQPVFTSLARVGNSAGRDRVLVPGLIVAYGASRVLGSRRAAAAVVHMAASYAVSNAIASVLKPALGRERPYASGDPLQFHPFSKSGDEHSFPSAHAVHAFSLAVALSDEAGRPWASTLGYSAAVLVGWSRIYADQHWLSDVVGAGVIGAVSSRETGRWLRARSRGGAPAAVHVSVVPHPDGWRVAVDVPW